ncbi:uncharacterized protein V1518DRAFT_407705 [Limtongia smithiae]|uniref:uncharacterized protein n=1 Tax=Limtongia smithiae TaxID=1125753 RepID=UPI0034CDDF3E
MEFQAVILCGPGAQLEPLVSPFLPKALLPIANRPMVYYALDWCQRAGISSAILATSPGSSEQLLSQYIALTYSSTSRAPLKVEVVAADGETGEVVHKLRDKIKHDFVLLPCDFITDLPPQILFDMHRNQSVRNIGTSVWYLNQSDGIDKKTLSMFILLPSTSHILTYSEPNLTIHTPVATPHPKLLDIYARPKGSDQLKVRMSMLWEYPQATISTTLLESFVYLFSRRVLDYNIDGTKSSDAAAGAAAPAVADHELCVDPGHHRAWKSRDAKYTTFVGRYICSRCCGTASVASLASGASGGDPNADPSLSKWKRPFTKVVRDIARGAWRHARNADQDTIGFYIVPEQNYFVRCKSVSAYFEANRMILKHTSYVPPPSTATARGAAIGRDSIIGIGTELGEKTNVKRSIVGADCTLGRECRISGCVIMDGVTVGDGVFLDNCLIAKGVTIDDRARLSGCTVEAGYTITKGTQSKNEVLRGYSADGLLDSTDDEHAVEDSSEEGSESEDDDEGDDDDDDDEENEVGDNDLVEGEDEGVNEGDDDIFDRG